MLPHEKQKFDAVDEDLGSRYWLPIQWAFSIIYSARQDNLIKSDYFCERICEEIRKFRNGLANLCKFDWVPLPLAYPQLVYLAVNVHFLINLISKQEIILPTNESNITGMNNVTTELRRWIPLAPAVQFFFYMAWTKVAMVLINPFGEDDDDFETNALIDRNFKVGMKIADGTSGDLPTQLKDSFWNRSVEALYSEESVKNNERQDGLVGSAAKLGLPNDVQQVLMIPLKRASTSRISCTPQQLRRRMPRQSALDSVNTDSSRRPPKGANRKGRTADAFNKSEQDESRTEAEAHVTSLTDFPSGCGKKPQMTTNISSNDTSRYVNQAYVMDVTDNTIFNGPIIQQNQQHEQYEHQINNIPDRPATGDDDNDDDILQQNAKM